MLLFLVYLTLELTWKPQISIVRAIFNKLATNLEGSPSFYGEWMRSVPLRMLM